MRVAKIDPGSSASEPTFREQLKGRPYARLHSYGGKSPKVELTWNLHPDAEEDQIFKITIGKEDAYINKEELLYWLRVV